MKKKMESLGEKRGIKNNPAKDVELEKTLENAQQQREKGGGGKNIEENVLLAQERGPKGG